MIRDKHNCKIGADLEKSSFWENSL